MFVCSAPTIIYTLQVSQPCSLTSPTSPYCEHCQNTSTVWQIKRTAEQIKQLYNQLSQLPSITILPLPPYSTNQQPLLLSFHIQQMEQWFQMISKDYQRQLMLSKWCEDYSVEKENVYNDTASTATTTLTSTSPSLSTQLPVSTSFCFPPMEEEVGSIDESMEQTNDQRLQNDSVPANDSSIPLSLDKPAISLADFQLLKVIGKGSFGKVMLVRMITNGKLVS